MPTPLTDFAKYVRPEVPECPEPMLLDAILRAAIHFCRETLLITDAFSFTTSQGQDRYAIDAGEDMTVDTIIEVRREGDSINLTPSNYKEFESLRLDLEPGAPDYYYLDGDELVFAPTPDSAEDFVASFSAIPTDDASGVPDELARRYKEKIANGAKATLMAMASQPWTNLDAAALNAALFRDAIERANLRRAKGGGERRLHTTGSYF